MPGNTEKIRLLQNGTDVLPDLKMFYEIRVNTEHAFKAQLLSYDIANVKPTLDSHFYKNRLPPLSITSPVHRCVFLLMINRYEIKVLKN